MIDADTIKILERAEAILPSKDSDWVELQEFENDGTCIERLRKWLDDPKRRISTALDIPLRWKGRIYRTLHAHPYVKAKKKRVRELRAILKKKRVEALMNQRKADPRTAHWYERTGT